MEMLHGTFISKLLIIRYEIKMQKFYSPDAHSETCQTSKMELFAITVHGFQSSAVFAKRSIVDF